jgi:hypothetical protein
LHCWLTKHLPFIIQFLETNSWRTWSNARAQKRMEDGVSFG